MASTHDAAAQARTAANQERAELRTALNAEKRGYVQRGLEDRAKQVDDQLDAVAALDEPEPAPATADTTATKAAKAATGRASVKAAEAAEAAVAGADTAAAATPASN